MLVLMLEQCKKKGFEMRADVEHSLNMAAVSPMAKAKLDPVATRRVAKKVDDLADYQPAAAVAPDDPRDGLYAGAMFALVLVDEGLYQDAKSGAVVSSLLLLEEAQADDKSEDAGSIWHVRETAWRQKAKHLLTRAKLLGYFLDDGPQSIAFNLPSPGSKVRSH